MIHDLPPITLSLSDKESKYVVVDFLLAHNHFQVASFASSASLGLELPLYGPSLAKDRPCAFGFNHKTGAEDVHFTSLVSEVESDEDADSEESENQMNDTTISQNSLARNGSPSRSDLEGSLTSGDDLTVLEMIMVKDVKARNEVFNTYGSLGNAALLHRYGFTEAENPYDILNIDLELVEKWSSSLFSCRHHRRGLSLWRKLDYSGCLSQTSEYFEISFIGEPEVELLVLLYIILLPDEGYHELDLVLSSRGDFYKSANPSLLEKSNVAFLKSSELNKDLLLTKSVCVALLSLADIRESLYGSSSLEDDIEALNKCCSMKEPSTYYSLVLRISERRILEKFRSYATCGGNIIITPKNLF
ncbi:hypothetical protein ACH5RR_012783 [Cinchona calisaya]|uniref:Uncharacterized protein n=1 Tax=Cinchona calisaya TaxID=153742 RepID=A0ABD3ABC6_9GENT